MLHFMLGNKGAHTLNGNSRNADNDLVNALLTESLASLVKGFCKDGKLVMDHYGRVSIRPDKFTRAGYVKLP